MPFLYSRQNETIMCTDGLSCTVLLCTQTTAVAQLSTEHCCPYTDRRSKVQTDAGSSARVRVVKPRTIQYAYAECMWCQLEERSSQSIKLFKLDGFKVQTILFLLPPLAP